MVSVMRQQPNERAEGKEHLAKLLTESQNKVLRCGHYVLSKNGSDYHFYSEGISATLDQNFEANDGILVHPALYAAYKNGKSLSSTEIEKIGQQTWLEIEDPMEAQEYAAHELDKMIKLAQDPKNIIQSPKLAVSKPVQSTVDKTRRDVSNLNLEVATMVENAMEEASEAVGIVYIVEISREEINEFLQRTAKQRGWNEQKTTLAATRIMNAMKTNIYLQELHNKVRPELYQRVKNKYISRLLQDQVENIY